MKLSRDTFAWYRRYPARALSGMKGLNPEQRGVYGTIIDLCYDRRGPLADDDMAMARECECDVRRYRRIKAELLAMGRILVDAEAGTIYDDRAVRELVAAQMFSESQAKRARATNRKPTTSSQMEKNTGKNRDRPDDKPEVLQNLQHLGHMVEPISPPRSLKSQDKNPANREEKRRLYSSPEREAQALTAQAPPPSPLIGGGGAPDRLRQKGKPQKPENEAERREALEAFKREQIAKLGLETQTGEGRS